MKRLQNYLMIPLLLFLLIHGIIYGSSKIRGKVTDKGTGEPIPGANVILKNTNLGAATDIEGEYMIIAVPSGKYTLQISYLGYKSQQYEIEVPDNRTLEFNAQLEYMVLEGEEILITAQAEGQVQAINQQKSALTVKNIVSAAKIEELPEANAAEAVGRLPGISLLREGGEGSKVVIRGLSPQYNKIQLNGVSMAATGEADRSVDLSMISPYILSGIEVSKTAMADQEADHLGGTVNFILKGAPKKPSFNFTAQGGYNGLRDEIGNYYYVLGGGKRFFDDKLGVFTQINLERTDRSNNSAGAGYQMQHDTITLANSLNLEDIDRVNKRMGGVLVFDYESATTKIKLSNTLNKIDINTFLRQENFDAVGRNHNYYGNYSERDLHTMINALDVEQFIGNVKITGGVSYSRSSNKLPEQISMNAQEANAFVRNWTWDDYQIYPFDIVTKALNDTTKTYLNRLVKSSSDMLEEEEAANLNFEFGFKIGSADLKLKFGGEYKHKYKKYDYEQSEIPIAWNDLDIVRLYLKDRFGLTNYDIAGDFPYAPFIDRNYNAGDFKAGVDYTISRVPNKNTMVDVYHEIENLTSVRGIPTGKTVYYDYVPSISNDYYGYENYFGAYIMPTITLGGNKVIFIPGFRYEYNKTEYTANRSNSPGRDTDPYVYFPYTSTRKNEYLLPMVHLKYQVNYWFDIRASYTQTLSRPDYVRIIPTWTTYGNSITWNNVNLKPAEAKNLDLFLSFYSDKLGLLTFGVFNKQIEGFIYGTTTWIADSSYLQPEWPESVKPGGQINGFINNPNTAKLWGIEAEWQSNFWFLPGIWRGLVINVNYTYTNSDLKYPRTVPIYQYVQVGPIKIPKIVGTGDGSYNARLLDQPTHIFNFTVGFDYKGFSVRGSAQFKSDVFRADNWYKELQQTTDPLTLWTVKVRQMLPVDGLQIYFNINNLTKAVDQTSNYGTGWFSYRSYYGLTADLGITYSLN
ncbi:TonB-dependent receptor [Melioribacter sp. OK-6-Me]|uniref:TonB-dependent receptor n=1 Tax=unclassified Melioribacter TaxID=2627329 RepID=UPI003EDA7197